jgi:hypothetical protein
MRKILMQARDSRYLSALCREADRYLSEFDFRYNARQITDSERAFKAIRGAAGKRLRYQGTH